MSWFFSYKTDKPLAKLNKMRERPNKTRFEMEPLQQTLLKPTEFVKFENLKKKMNMLMYMTDQSQIEMK